MSSSKTLGLGSAVSTYLANSHVNDGKANEVAEKISSQINDKQAKLVDIVLLLRPQITSTETDERQKAVECISAILGHLDPATLLKNDVSVIIDFYANTFEDSACMKEILQGLANVIDMQHFYLSQATIVLNRLKEFYQPANYPAPVRYITFTILERVLLKFHANFQKTPALSDLFIETFIGIATGEKDPRNLLLSFRINTIVCSSLSDISKYKEDLFDVLFCYFPITFKPPKSDPYKISNLDLKLALRRAISSSPQFEEDAFGNLIDKLAASSLTVKNDTILTLNACVENYGGEAVVRNWLPLWNALKFDILQGSAATESEGSLANEVNNYETSLQVVAAISNQLIQFNEATFDKFHAHVFDELQVNFEQQTNLKQSCAILATLAGVNADTFNKVMSKIPKLLFENMSNMDLTKEKLLILNLSFFFDAYIKVFGETKAAENVIFSNNELNKHKDEILMLLSKSLKTSSNAEITIKVLALVQFTKLIKMAGYLDHNEVLLIIQYFTETAISSDNKNIHYACLEGLKATRDVYETDVINLCIGTLFNHLFDKALDSGLIEGQESVPVDRVLRLLLEISTSKPNLVIRTICGLSAKLSEISKYENLTELSFMIVSTLHSLISANYEVLGENDIIELKKAVQFELFTSLMNDKPLFGDNESLELLSSFFYFLTLKTPLSLHPEELRRTTDFFLKNAKILDTPRRSALCFVKILAAIDKNCKWESDDCFIRTVKLVQHKALDMSDFEKVAYFQLITLLANKWCSPGMVEESMEFQSTSYVDVEIQFWAAKGLVMRNAQETKNFIDHFLDLLHSQTEGAWTARLFEILTIDLPHMENLKNHSWNNNVRLLHKQKFFNDVAPRIISLFQSSDNYEIKANYLMALSLILRHTPDKVTESYMPELLPLLLQAMELKNTAVRVSALRTVLSSMDRSSSLISEHVHSLIPILLRFIVPSICNTFVVRSLALQVLQALTVHTPLNYLLPMKDDVIRSLSRALDDKKRNIRKLAIDASQAFYELGQVPFE
ncbi:LAMI_0C08460g1_1 [Lachancea mirantina]|uniref:MMS19 nucleotide excision repair protein n=1 Tax=Lachancea mirantina TaxID=1230905 RepID=A0A1G4J595_9SACH|nr:LAMI_0C08460g1_1 [Lachancea mirantina]